MPHLLWIMFGIIVLACLATYLIPAGEFAVNEAGQITGTDFHFLGHQTPVSPWGALMRVKSGMVGAATIAFVVMISGANINVVLETGVMDDLMNWGVYKLKDKGTGILVSMMMILMAYLGGFGGTDALIAVVPVGVMFSKKLKLDPICALAVTTFAALVGFGTGPAQQATTQMLMGVTPYSGFFTRLVIMNFFLFVAIIMTMQYIKKIRKDPAASIMYQDGWRPDAIVNGSEEELLKHVEMNWRKVAVIVLFVLQYLIIAIYPLMGGDSNLTFDFMLAVMIITMIVVGIIGGMSAEKLADAFAKGLGSMAFVAFVIGLAKVISLVLADGNVMDKTEQILQAAKEGAKKYFDEQVSLLTKFSSIDCGTGDEEGNKKIVAIVENLLNTIQGIQIEKHYSKGFGQHIVAKLKPENPDGKIILSAHMDTVFKKGDTAENPPHIEGDRFYGLGSADCKGGLLVSIYGVKILQENGLLPNKEIVFIFNCDEESGTPVAHPVFDLEIPGTDMAFVFEPSRLDNGVVTSRKGTIRLPIEVHGVKAHSGNNYLDGRSATIELASKLLKFYESNENDRGIQFNAVELKGGENGVGVIPDYASATVGVRVLSRADIEHVKEIAARIEKESYIPDTTTKIGFRMVCVPMERTEENVKLYEHVKAAGKLLDHELPEQTVGGSGDASYFSYQGVPSVDGLGPYMYKIHSKDESMRLSSMVEKTELFTVVLATVK